MTSADSREDSFPDRGNVPDHAGRDKALEVGGREAAVGRQRLARQESALLAGEETDDAGDVVDRAETTERRAHRCPAG